MQPPRSKHARSLHALLGVLLLVGSGLGGAGCTSSPQPPVASFQPTDSLTTAVGRDSALAVLASMRRAAFDSAFAALSDYAVTRTVRTERLEPNGTVTARRHSVLRYPPGDAAGTLQESDSTGHFRSGSLLGMVASATSRTDRPPDGAAQMLADDPPYVEPRTQEAYRYALGADALSDGTPVYVVEATARADEAGRDQSVRYARLLLDRSTRALVGLTLIRIDEGLLFSEYSRSALRLQRGPDGTWMPHEKRVRAFLHVPFRAPRYVRTASTFSDYTDP
ncbi:MAG: hypothetical protein BRD55_03925 [Bacteroidetes bacterium SW_9_63_38]|nr:MAG: hypothetical protein BRD55_03925 [Bacteroidetes bacterium SW_9_63_38]